MKNILKPLFLVLKIYFYKIILILIYVGMTGHCPDYTLLMIGANAGIVGMTKEVLYYLPSFNNSKI